VYDTFPVRFWNSYLDGREPAIVVQEFGASAVTLIPVAPLRGSFSQSGAGENLGATWATDGTAIVFHATANRARAMYEETDTALYQVAASGGTPRRLTPSGSSYTNAQFSPDGRSLYSLEVRNSSAKQIYFVTRLARLSGPDWKQLSIVSGGPGWDRSVGAFTVSADSRHVYVEAEDDGTVKLFKFAADGGVPEIVYTPAAGALSGVRAAATTIVARQSSSTDPGALVAAVSAGAGAFLVHGEERQEDSLGRRAAARRRAGQELSRRGLPARRSELDVSRCVLAAVELPPAHVTRLLPHHDQLHGLDRLR
jgi:hypothetical protein